jgi:catechol 2,3-dioxygenase-like lactoylglutathione lyase family enzyme
MIKARRIGHAVFESPDIERLADHYVNVIGMVVIERGKDKIYLATKLGQLAIELRKSSSVAECKKLSFEVASDASLTEVQNELLKAGITSERASDMAPGIANTLLFNDPKGTQIELFTSWDALTELSPTTGIGIEKFGHIAYYTPDVATVMEFYVNILGFKVSDWIGDFFVFLRCNPDHHTINLMSGPDTRLHHIAFQLDDWSQMKTACDVLGANKNDLIWGPVRHGPGHNIATYHRDPDNHIIELFCDLDMMIDEELGYFDPRPWHRDRPQRPKVWEPGPTTNIWGPLPSDDFRK